MNEVGTEARLKGSLGTEAALLRPAAVKPLSATFKMALVLGVKAGVRLHLQSGADVNARDSKGQSPLIIAASRGHVEICFLLLEAGAQLDLTDTSGCTALRAAANRKRLEVVSLLQRHMDEFASQAEGIQPATSMPVSVVPADAPEILASDSGDGNGDEFDLSVWVPEIEPDAPLEDPAILAAIETLDQDLGSHIPIDQDEDWSDVEIDLPEFIARRRKRDGVEEAKWLREASELILVGLRDGEIPGRLVEAITPVFGAADDEGGTSDHNALLRIALSDIGIRILNDEDAPWDPLPPEDEVESRHASTLAEAMTFLRALLSPGSDPLILYLNSVSRTTVLSRDEEGDIGRSMEDGMRQALSAIGRSSVAMADVLATLGRVERGETRWQAVFADDEIIVDFIPGDPDDDAEDDMEAEEGSGSICAVALQGGLAGRMAELHTGRAALLRASTEPEMLRRADELARLLLTLGLRPGYVEQLRSIVEREDSDQSIRYELAAALGKAKFARLRLFHHNQKLVFWLARKHRGRGLALMDLVQEGCIGLLKAVEKFDYTKGFKFSTYAGWWVRQAMSRAIGDQARLIRVPIHMGEIINKVRRGRDAYEKQHGRQPTAEELAAQLELDSRRVARALTLLHEPVPLDDLDRNGSLDFDWIPDNSPDPEERACANALGLALRQAMECLGEREHKVISLRFGLDTGVEHTLEEVGQIYGITRERIRQIEAKALGKLEHPLRSRKLRTFL